MTIKNNSTESFLPVIAQLVMLFGLIGSLYFMFRAGSNQKSVVLIGLFTGWVISPYVVIFIATKKLKQIFVHTLSLLNWVAIVLSFGSLVVYSGAFTMAGPKPAAKFLIVPLVSWIVILVIFLIERRVIGKSNR